uniref:Uncharacterized protein n=1 Tax=Glossina austeni TaxID=7395 RepID=A0A1A9UIB1_GLOAU
MSYFAAIIKVAGISVTASVDTGGTTSFIIERFAETIKGRRCRTPHKANIQLADWSKIAADSSFLRPVQFGSLTTMSTSPIKETEQPKETEIEMKNSKINSKTLIQDGKFFKPVIDCKPNKLSEITDDSSNAVYTNTSNTDPDNKVETDPEFESDSAAKNAEKITEPRVEA